MKLKEFESLVDRACYGNMLRGDVVSVVERLKALKADIMREISVLPIEERKAALDMLNSLQYRLYKAIIWTNPEQKPVTEHGIEKRMKQYSSADYIAYMVICYDCK